MSTTTTGTEPLPGKATRPLPPAPQALPALTWTTRTPAATSWRMVDLGAGDDSVARAVNDRGHVAGTRGNGDAFLWRDGTITNLGAFRRPYQQQ